MLQGLHTGVRGVLKHAESVRNLLGHAALNSITRSATAARVINAAGTHTVHRVRVTPGVLHGWSAVFMMTVLSTRGPYSGCACIISAATPATKGVDMDVPVFTLEPVRCQPRWRKCSAVPQRPAWDAVRTVHATRGEVFARSSLPLGANRVAQVLAELQGQLT